MGRIANLVGGALLFWATADCAGGLLSAIAKGAQVAQMLGSLVDLADDGQRLYFDRHPSMESERQVAERLLAARASVARANRALAAAQADGADLDQRQAEALKAYDELRALYDELGILEGKAPPGGAETDAPVPKPLDLPTVAEIVSSI